MKQIEKAIIIGGGPAGIAAALRLQQKNRISCTIYEVRDKPTTLGGAIGIPSNGLRLLSRLNLYNEVVAKGAQTSNLNVRSSEGKLMGNMSLDAWSKQQTGFGYFRIRRTDLMDILLDAASKANIPIHFGKRITKIEETDYTVTASFSDGSQEDADFVIGADGIHSSVRKIYVDPECMPVYSGIANVFSLLSTSELSKSPPEIEGLNATLTANGMFGLSPANPTHDLLYWFFSREVDIPINTDRDGWEERGKKELEEGKANMLGLLGDDQCEWLEFLRDVIDKTDAFKFYPIYKVPTGRPWHKGRVLIIGDAAHAMPPHASQGVSMALEDVFLLSNLLHSGRFSVEDSLRIYEEKRRPRTESMLHTAEKNGDIRKEKGPWELWANGFAITAGLWFYKTAGLQRLGLGQKPLAYDVEDETW
ncbi:FAD/NAD(P)-binding domain-containing protein [Aaosphaeria arxii CBS 175.79]|uniref:FAD/NAD(P)-binding domain-containing protein n=1 Tax=Aaosphaeria arxii CBS 175.79 TaxID=1450172 RepID=A0A6A5XA40_9PLEO|nr:FAD/NAD(P)-binding domain-containing protein [Aaosphaeria arxii CBS 175.79]KAF2009634.1 FAD/NAD(P)-binding domain-containing protein [Aaosphaeria arxii CBS 175.79]